MATSSSSIGGLVSGLDSKTLISQLMQVAAQPQTKLKTQLTSTNAQVTAAQSINAKAASMTSLAKDLADVKTFTTASATSSSPRVTATATGTPAATSVSFSVQQMASAASYASGPLTLPTSVAPGDQFTITRGGQSFAIDQQTSASALVAAINASGAGVLATVVTDQASGSQNLVITGKDTGADATLSVSGLGDTGGRQLSSGSDAAVDLGGLIVSSKSNTFTNLIEGASITLGSGAGAADTGLVTVSTAVSTSSISSKVTNLVGSMNAVLADLAFHTKAPATGTTASATNGGLLAGEATFRDLSGSILDTISASTGADAAVKAGLSVGRDGTVSFDSSKFDALFKSDPKTAQDVLTAFASAVQSAGKSASDSTSGSVTAFVTGSKSTATSLTDRIADWDVRLDAKQARLTAQYAALETALQKLKSQSDSLTSALAALSGNTGN